MSTTATRLIGDDQQQGGHSLEAYAIKAEVVVDAVLATLKQEISDAETLRENQRLAEERITGKQAGTSLKAAPALQVIFEGELQRMADQCRAAEAVYEVVTKQADTRSAKRHLTAAREELTELGLTLAEGGDAARKVVRLCVERVEATIESLIE